MKADIVIKSNAVFNGIQDNTFKGGVAIKGNKILAVGDDDSIASLTTDMTEVIDVGDKLIMPGFIEGHGHFCNGALFNSRYFLNEIYESTSEEDAVKMVKDYAEKNPDVDKIIGQGWFPANWNDAPLPSKKSLDEVIYDKPVYLEAADGHTAWLNSKALEEAKIPKSKDDPLSAFIEKDEKGELTGILHEAACFQYVQPYQYSMPLHISYEVQEQLVKGMAECGVTMFNDLSGILAGQSYDALEKMEKDGILNVRVNIADGLNFECDISSAEALDARFHSPFLQQTNIKGMVDGVTSTYTALLLDPYADNPKTCGTAQKTFEEYKNAIIYANSKGYPVRLHCIGDGAVHWALDCFEESQKINDCSTFRNTIEHIESINPRDIERFAKLNIVASMQPAHLSLDANEQELRLGRDRWKTGWAFRSLLDAGAILAFGTDYPVTSYEPFSGIYFAVTRKNLDGTDAGCNPEQAITVAEALRAYTYGGACACGRDKELGSLEAGKLADVVVLDRDLFTISPESILDTKVVLTMVDGNIIYRRQ